MLVVASAAVASAAVVLTGHLAGFMIRRAPPPLPRPLGTTAAAQRFEAAWRRSLLASWSVEESLQRVTRAGGHLAFSVHEAQRPPDSLQYGLGAVAARRGRELLACATTATGRLGCRSQATAPPYAAVVANRMAALEQLVGGPRALYAVAQVGGCFQLTLRVAAFPVPPYGRRAVFCFDPATGAPAGSVVERDAAIDRTTVLSVHAPATDADLALPSDTVIVSGAPGR